MYRNSTFSGELDFLSNFYPVSVEVQGFIFPSVEHAYQALKSSNIEEMENFVNITAGQAKRLGRKIPIRPDWNIIKLDVMYELLKIKFSNKVLRDLLLATEDYELVENNYWGDTYWGVYKGIGENHLGKLLMRVREEIRSGKI